MWAHKETFIVAQPIPPHVSFRPKGHEIGLLHLYINAAIPLPITVLSSHIPNAAMLTMNVVLLQHDECHFTMHPPIHHLPKFDIGWPTLYGPTFAATPSSGASLRTPMLELADQELSCLLLPRPSKPSMLVYQEESDRIYPW